MDLSQPMAFMGWFLSVRAPPDEEHACGAPDGMKPGHDHRGECHQVITASNAGSTKRLDSVRSAMHSSNNDGSPAWSSSGLPSRSSGSGCFGRRVMRPLYRRPTPGVPSRHHGSARRKPLPSAVWDRHLQGVVGHGEPDVGVTRKRVDGTECDQQIESLYDSVDGLRGDGADATLLCDRNQVGVHDRYRELGDWDVHVGCE